MQNGVTKNLVIYRVCVANILLPKSSKNLK